MLAVSSPIPLFNERLLETARWAAHHYVAPLSTILARTGPANLPKPTPLVTYSVEDAAPEALVEIYETVVSGRRSPGWFVATRHIDDQAINNLAVSVAKAGKSVLVLVPTAAEVAVIAASIRSISPERVIEVAPTVSDASATTRWSYAATRPGSIVVGTERVALWPVADLGLAIVLEEGRHFDLVEVLLDADLAPVVVVVGVRQPVFVELRVAAQQGLHSVRGKCQTVWS